MFLRAGRIHEGGGYEHFTGHSNDADSRARSTAIVKVTQGDQSADVSGARSG